PTSSVGPPGPGPSSSTTSSAPHTWLALRVVSPPPTADQDEPSSRYRPRVYDSPIPANNFGSPGPAPSSSNTASANSRGLGNDGSAVHCTPSHFTGGEPFAGI